MSNQYTYSVPFTEEELVECYINQEMTQEEIAQQFGTTQHVVWRAMRKMAIPTRVAAKRNQLGPLNTSWKGGRLLQGQSAKGTGFSDAGYWYVRKPNHPNATKGGYVAEHIVVATDMAGRALEDGECVHHIDMNKRNNAEANLVICTHREHRQFGLQLELIAIELYHRGFVVFNPERGYVLREGVMPNVADLR